VSSRILKYHPDAVAEVTGAVRWYMEQSAEAAISFFDQFQLAEQKVLGSSSDSMGRFWVDRDWFSRLFITK
jgi:hypothetical protein